LKLSFISVIALFVAFNTTLCGAPLTLEDAINQALQNSKLKKISQHDLAIAKARYDQAMSASYPIIDATVVGNMADDVFVDETKGSMDSPIGVIDIDFDHIIMGENTVFGKIDITYPLYTGGKISAIQKQAGLGVEISKEAKQQTRDEIIFTVTKYFTSTILTHEITALAKETQERMRAILTLTEAFYQGGSLSVKKTDYLRIKMTYANISSMVEEMKTNEQLARSALLFSMGNSTKGNIAIADYKLDFEPLSQNFEDFLTTLYSTNHQLTQAKMGVEVYEAQIQEAKSDYLPTIALYANAKTLYNNYDGGISNDTNRNTFNVGIALKYNLYHGGLTDGRVKEARLNKLKLLSQKDYLDDALQLQLKHAYLKAQRSAKQVVILKDAVETAAKNSDLNFRAYQEDMVETKDVIEAQIFESLTKASYLRARHDAIIAQANLYYILGTSGEKE